MEELKKKDGAAGVAVGTNARVATDNLGAKLDAANAAATRRKNLQQLRFLALFTYGHLVLESFSLANSWVGILPLLKAVHWVP